MVADTVYVVDSYPAPGWDDHYDFNPVFFEKREDAETLRDRIEHEEFSREYNEYLAEKHEMDADIASRNDEIRRANAALEAAGLPPTKEKITAVRDPYDFTAWKRVYVEYPKLTVMTVKRGSL